MSEQDLQDLIEECASEVLERLSQVLPEVEDEGALGELVLERALETYRFVAQEENNAQQ